MFQSPRFDGLALAAISIMLAVSVPARAEADRLAALIPELSAANVAVLDASLSTTNLELITSEGSINDALWSQMTTLGWMAQLETQQGGPAGVRLKTFALTDEGRRQIPGFLKRATKP